MQESVGVPFSLIVLVSEVVTAAVLLTGWLLGSRRMEFKTHHWAVNTVIAVHLIIVSLWMVPRAFERIGLALSSPLVNWYQLAHDTVGTLALAMGTSLVVLFLLNRGLPLRLLRKTRKLMFATIGLWTVALLLGAYWFLLAWVLV